MKINILKILIILYVLLSASNFSFAWTKDTWGPISRGTIARIAGEMIDFSWTPKSTITNNTLTNNPPFSYTFTPGTIYHGEAYIKSSAQQNWSDFYTSVNNTPGGTTNYGNDCSGFVSMAWRLPTRYTTSDFESDAISDGGYVTKLGEIGKSDTVTLLRGDALNRSGNHVVLFDYYASGGIVTMEQTPGPRTNYTNNKNNEMRSYWTWSRLASYRPIRRNNIDEGNYVYQTQWGSYGTTDGKFSYPSAVVVDSLGNVYVADSGNNRIQKFTSSGDFLTKWGAGTGTGAFDSPEGVAVDSVRNVYVADSVNGRIQKFNSIGTFIPPSWGTAGSNAGEFYYPEGIAIDTSGSVFVADYGNDRIQKFNSNGSFLAKWDAGGSVNWQFKWPEDIAIDTFSNVYVADAGNNRILKFTNSGTLLGKWESFGTLNEKFNYPQGIAVDTSGNVYVADALNHRMLKFTNTGVLLNKWGTKGAGNGQFNGPEGVAVDSLLNVYVADVLNHRIQKFKPVSPYPSAPSDLTATIASATQINLSWTDNSGNETGFKIKRKAGIRGQYNEIGDVAANVRNYADNSVSSGTEYYYAVWAYNTAGNSAYSNEASAFPPSPPTNLKATASSASQINITWTDNSINETGFEIYRKIGTEAWQLLHTAAADANKYSDTSAAGNASSTTYSYYIRACNKSVCSPETNTAVVPYKPSKLAATAVSSTQINLSWIDNSNNETGFQIQRKPGLCTSTDSWSLIKTTTANATFNSDTGLTSGTTYSYRTRAIARSSATPYAFGYSLWSNCVNATTP